jgi:hypothetical protein
MGSRKLDWRGRITEVAVNITTATTTEVIAAVAGKTIRIYKIWLRLNGANNVDLKSATTALAGQLQYGNSGEIIYEDHSGNFPISCAAAEAFNLVTSAANGVSGRVWYTRD